MRSFANLLRAIANQAGNPRLASAALVRKDCLADFSDLNG